MIKIVEKNWIQLKADVSFKAIKNRFLKNKMMRFLSKITFRGKYSLLWWLTGFTSNIEIWSDFTPIFNTIKLKFHSNDWKIIFYSRVQISKWETNKTNNSCKKMFQKRRDIRQMFVIKNLIWVKKMIVFLKPTKSCQDKS